jgi:hypothetical protein
MMADADLSNGDQIQYPAPGSKNWSRTNKDPR